MTGDDPNGPRNVRSGRPIFRNRRRIRQRRKREHSTGKRLVVLFVIAAALGAVGGVLAVGLTGARTFLSSCSLESLQPVAIGQNSFVYAADGSLLGSIPAEQNRQPIRLEDASHWVGEATVAIEDRRFFEHEGLDYEGIARALLKNIESGEIVQGGSTISQQLVRNLYIGNERSLERKVEEACLALKLERSLSKEEILETYLNQVYFGNQAYGVEAAAQTYFSKSAADLDYVEAALVAGLPQAPSAFDPLQRPDQALRRRNDVLRAMNEAGYITLRQLDDGVQAPLGLEQGRLYSRIREPFFFSFVRDRLIAKYGVAKVRSGGLRVFTTVDPRYQNVARKVIRQTLNENGDPASAIVSINPRNGAIRAMASVIPGARNVEFNLAAQGRRQAGSAFKTFVLVEAVRRGINPDTTVYVSAPFHWQPDENSEPWDVKTYDHSYYGPSTIRAATLRSDNTVYARLTLDLGPDQVVETARDMGIETRLLPVASVGLGSNSVSVLEMASAYATLAAGGVYSEPFAIRRVILPDGTEDDEAGWGRPRRRRVIPDGVAYEVTQILEQNIQAGTGTRANIERPAAGKTGTTDDFGDAWFVGYTPGLATAVWVGFPNAQTEMRNVHGISVAGGTFPATIWGLFMSRALKAVDPENWFAPTEFVAWRPFQGKYQFSGAPEEEEEEKEKKEKGKKDKEPATDGDEVPAPQEGTSEDETPGEVVPTPPEEAPPEESPPPVEVEPPPESSEEQPAS